MTYDFNTLKQTVGEATNRPTFYTDFEDVSTDKLHQISELTEWIRTKSKGSDIREIIAQLFERTWLENIREGNANMEVAQARGSFNELSERFDNIYNILNSKGDTAEIKRMLTNILDGTPKGTYQNISALRSAKPTGEAGIFITTDNGHWNYWNGNTWVDGGPYQSPLEGIPNQFGVLFDGLLTIDLNSRTITMKKDTWFSFGNKNHAPRENISISYTPSGMSEYVVYDYQNSGLSVLDLNNISRIKPTQVILAIMYKQTLHYPINSRFVKTIGYNEYTQGNNFGSIIQGLIEYDKSTMTFTFNGTGAKNEIIVSKGTSYYKNENQESLKIPSGYVHYLVFDILDRKFKLIPGAFLVDNPFASKYNEILIAMVYVGELTHFSSDNFIKLRGDVKGWNLEELTVNLQTKRTVMVTLGDSTTDGWRTSNYTSNNDNINSLKDGNNTYSGILNNIINQQNGYNFNHKIYNRGFSGKTINWLNENLEAVLRPITEKIDYAFIAMGINDMVYDANSVQSFKNDHITVIDKLLKKGIKPILVSTQAEFENYKRFGYKINSIADNVKKELANELGIPFIDYNKGTRNILNNSEYELRDLIPDMCHFGDLGHKKGAEFLASKLIHRTINVVDGQKIGYQNNKVISDLIYSDFLTDVEKQVKWITKTNGFNLEGVFNGSSEKVLFEALVYVDKPLTISFYGENCRYYSNNQLITDNSKLDVGLYKITVKNTLNQISKFRGLEFRKAV